MGQELTKSDVKRIQDEIDHRKLVLRPQITREIAEAAAQGDRSENFEYYAAKKANRENNGRINYLERVLRFAKIIDDSSKEDEVGLNNTVTLYFEEDDEEEVYRIVTSIRGHSLLGLISNESPIGRAVMGHKVGDRCEVTTENGASY
ncbi:MAG: transcription elongation factor GreA, partial [Oribacterium sp.]|nr:transcription elongation factor GreA [Oribacterium sp.]